MTSIKFRALTHNDHKLFFEALGEHGKDFQNIQQYMSQKCGKTTNKSCDNQEKKDQDKKEDDKKREQIRNFYNKLYNKLSQLTGKLDDRIEKSHQELYLLINYGEIWKKHGFKFNNKTKKLLEELVHQGYTTLRFKNKNVRLRTPSCKALKKINKIGVDEKVKVVTSRELPKDVLVEFHPATNRDWLKVQSMSQNPRVRARLSIQKRLSNVLEFLEDKWNVTQAKLNRTVDTWLKVPPAQQSSEDQQHISSPQAPQISPNGRPTFANTNGNQSISTPSDNHTLEIQNRLRLKPSSRHELNEVNITRVIPENHLDLSLTAYVNRLNSEKVPVDQGAKNCSTPVKETIRNSIGSNNILNGGQFFQDNHECSFAAVSTSSKLPLSLTTPDSSILLERSHTSDQPIIAQARKHLNILQSIAGSFEGCENSRTACEDTEDRQIIGQESYEPQHVPNFGLQAETLACTDSNQHHAENKIEPVIPALFDENAAIETDLTGALSACTNTPVATTTQTSSNTSQQPNFDCQNSKSVDFNIPKNVTLGDWFAMKDGTGNACDNLPISVGGDDANDAFPVSQLNGSSDDGFNMTEEGQVKDDSNDFRKHDSETINVISSKPQNHMIEIEKLAKGWTRQEEFSMSVGELYLVLKCPEKIVLEYTFEQFTINNSGNDPLNHSCVSDSMIDHHQDGEYERTATGLIPKNDSLMFRLLTAASLSLAQIDKHKEQKQKLEQQKVTEQSASKLKRRKGLIFDKSQSQSLGMTDHDIEARNQQVNATLRSLQPVRLSSFKRSR